MTALARNVVIDVVGDLCGLSGLHRILSIRPLINRAALFFLPAFPISSNAQDNSKGVANDAKMNDAHMVEQEDSYGRPIIIRYSDLLAAEQSGALLISAFERPSYMKKTSEQLSQAAKAKQTRGWIIIEPLIVQEEVLFFGKRGDLIKRRADELRITVKAVHRVLYRYWHYGQTKACLIPASERSGGKGNIRKPGSVKRGRPRKAVTLLHNPYLVGVNTTEKDHKIFRRAIDLFHKTKKLSIAKTYQRMHERFYNNGYSEVKGQRTPILKPSTEIPTVETFRAWFHKYMDDEATKRARTRGRDWDMNFRGLVGSAEQDLFGPCDRFEIDATIADVFLVSRYNRRYIIGRPTIYVVIDVFSRMIVGMYVGWKSPSWDGARLALLNAFSDKVSYCAKYGVDINQDEWPCHHLTSKVLADKGEIAGEAPLGMAENLDIQVESTATGRGDLKGVVESRFSIFNESTIHDLPGATTEDTRQRGEPDPRLSAALDIEEFTSIMIRAVLSHNLFSEKPHLLSKEMIADEVVPTPLHIWNWGLVNATGSVEPFDTEEVRIHLMHSGTATVYEDGIHFHQMRYVTERATKENWFSRARMKRTWPIEVRYTNDTDELWYYDPDRGTTEQCFHIAADARFKDMRLEEAVNLLEYQKVERDERKDAVAANRAYSHAKDDAVIKKAKAEVKDARKGLSKTSRTAGMRENRQVEQAVECAKERIAASSSNPTVGEASQESDAAQSTQSTLDDLIAQNQGSLIDRLRASNEHH